jgi:hypothetical protein
MAGWVARTRPLTRPLSPRGPQPVVAILRLQLKRLNGPKALICGVPASWYSAPSGAFSALALTRFEPVRYDLYL